ncbi:hypothetical protein AB0H73_19930 [Streptomyces olivoreticuli]
MVNAEIAKGDRARRTADGYTAAVRRLHARVEAAEVAIVEAETETDRAQQTLGTAVVFAGALVDALAGGTGDAWDIAHTLGTLTSGELTPQQALALSSLAPKRHR